MNKNEISLQVYTARFSKPYEDIFNFLSTQGMKKVELFEVSALEETKEILDKYSMTSASTHFGFDNLKDIKNIIEKLKKANIQYAIVPAPLRNLNQTLKVTLIELKKNGMISEKNCHRMLKYLKIMV